MSYMLYTVHIWSMTRGDPELYNRLLFFKLLITSNKNCYDCFELDAFSPYAVAWWPSFALPAGSIFMI